MNNKTIELSGNAQGKISSASLMWKPRAIQRTRKDIADWRKAIAAAENPDNPQNFQLQDLYKSILDDNLLTSQLENRSSKLFNLPYKFIDANGELDESQMAFMDNIPFREITEAILKSRFLEYSLIEFRWNKKIDGTQYLSVVEVPRSNIIPQKGLFVPDITQSDKGTKYREAKEYGVWWLEFGSADERGLINKAVPHVLMKSFTQSCWAELCEIFGIPPRYMKTNTQDPTMRKRAEQMMRDMGAAAWFIIDETEEFNFAQGVSTNGDVYKNLIGLCNNELSMLVSGAIIGQDTVNGSRSKDESAQDVLWELIMKDIALVQDEWNRKVIPALIKLGVLSKDVKLKFDIPENLDALWQKVSTAMTTYEFDIEWLNDKFGLKIVKERQTNIGLSGGGEGFFV